LAVIQFN